VPLLLLLEHNLDLLTLGNLINSAQRVLLLALRIDQVLVRGMFRKMRAQVQQLHYEQDQVPATGRTELTQVLNHMNPHLWRYRQREHH